MKQAVIHLRVPASLKARWIAISRGCGQKLADWIISRVERPMSLTTICIPQGVTFSALRLSLDPDGSLSFDAAVIKSICHASGIDTDTFVDDEDALCALIVAWYRVHRAQGGEPDPAAEAIVSEIAAEDELGQRFSLSPGRA